jgi:hypothetical protein
MLQPLSNPLQTRIRFFFHPLPSKEFGLCYLGLTKSIRLLLDSVGLTLLCRLVLYPTLGAIYSAVEMRVHTIYRNQNYKSYPLTFWSEPVSLIWLLFV